MIFIRWLNTWVAALVATIWWRVSEVRTRKDVEERSGHTGREVHARDAEPTDEGLNGRASASASDAAV